MKIHEHKSENNGQERKEIPERINKQILDNGMHGML